MTLFSVVDLPAPLRPISPTSPRSGTSRLIPRRMMKLEIVTLMSRCL
jgi:hypothetical protein